MQMWIFTKAEICVCEFYELSWALWMWISGELSIANVNLWELSFANVNNWELSFANVNNWELSFANVNKFMEI